MEIVYKILKILSNRNTSLYIYIYIYIKIYWERGGPGPKEGKDNNEIIDLSISLKKKTHEGMEEIGRVLQDEEKETQSAKRWAISLDDL